jgi:hypothetical protein
MVSNLMSKVEHIRVVPLKTQDFQDAIRLYRGLINLDRPGDADVSVGEAVAKMKASIIEKGFSIGTSEWGADVHSTVGRALKADFAAEDTPIMHFEPTTNQLLYHGKDVGLSEVWEDKDEFIPQMVRRIANAKIDQILADLDLGE